MHVVDAPRLDEDDKTLDNEMISFTDKCILCSIPKENVQLPDKIGTNSSSHYFF